MLQIDLWKRVLIWGLCVLGLALALPNAFYTRVETHNDAVAAIEAGAEDVDSSEDGHIIYCADTDLHAVSQALEAELGESQSTKLIWKPTTTTELDLEGMQKLMKLMDALDDDDDVQRVTVNFEASDEVMEQL